MDLQATKMGSGPTLLILHGLYGSGDNWFNIAKQLAEKFTVYLVDQRNHGKSPKAPVHNYTEMANDLHEFITKNELNKLNIIGHSMGGKTAMTYTLQYGSYVHKLISVDISPYSYEGLDSFKSQYSFHQSIVERFETAPIETTTSLKSVEDYFAEKITDTNIRRFLLKNLTRDSQGAFEWKLNVEAISANLLNVIDAAPPIKMGAQSFVDCLFIRGGKSPYITNEDMDGIRDIFSNARVITYDKAGHWLHAEEPERLVKDALDFLT